MKKIIFFFLALGAIMIQGLFAQQVPLSNFYNFNEYLINPAEAGYRNQLEGSLSHRLQWRGIEGAPTTTFLGVHGSLNEKMGLGGKVTIDQTNIIKQFSAAVSYSYRIVLNEKAKLNFGVSAIMLQNSIDFGEIIVADKSDNILGGSDQDGMTFDAEAGVMLEYGKGKLGISTSHLFESGVEYELSDRTGTFERVRQFSAYGSYLIDIDNNWDVEPFVLIRNQGVKSFQYELSALTSWKQTLFIGAGYRQNAGIIGRLGFQITEELMVAYAYEFSGSGIASYSNGSHEFMLGYKLNKKSKQKPKKKTLTTKVPIDNKETKETIEVVEKAKKINEVEVKKNNEAPGKKEVISEPLKIEESIDKKVFENKIPFNFKETSLGKEAKEILDRMAEELNTHENQKVIVEGHTCDIGTDEINMVYSTGRANRVKNYLKSKGVKDSQIEIKAMRDSKPLAPNVNSENRQKNRRAEVRLVK